MKTISPEVKNVVVFEDNHTWRSRYRGVLEDFGWIIVGEAVDMQTALKLIEKMKDLQVSLALIDGIIEEQGANIRLTEVYKVQGRVIAEKIKAAYPNVVTLGVSGVTYLQESDPNIDYAVGKEHGPITQAIQNISEQ